MRIGIAETNQDLLRASHIPPQEAGAQVATWFN
jgi:hypothetical protein